MNVIETANYLKKELNLQKVSKEYAGAILDLCAFLENEPNAEAAYCFGFLMGATRANIGVIQVHNMTTTELLTFLLTTKSVKRGQSQFGFGKVDLKLTQRTDGEFLEVHIYNDQNKDMICVSAKVEDVEHFKHVKDSEK